MNHVKGSLVVLACCGLLSFCGCFGGGSDVAEVTGTITVDGQPIEHAVVSFTPVQGHASVGMTDAKGNYTLFYLRNVDGAEIGEHKVTVKTRIIGDGSYGDEGSVQSTGREELLPKKYWDRNQTELRATVERGSNTFNFDLETE